MLFRISLKLYLFWNARNCPGMAEADAKVFPPVHHVCSKAPVVVRKDDSLKVFSLSVGIIYRVEHLAGSMDNPTQEAESSTQSIAVCIPILVVVQRTRSSIKARELIFLSPRRYPNSDGMDFNTMSMIRLYKRGESGFPCFTPLRTSIMAEFLLLWRRKLFAFL